jgi:predicted P-loop ATPase
MKMRMKSILLTGALAMGANALMGAQATQASDSWLDQYYKAKLGRSSPAEEARLNAERANTAFREETTVEVAGPANPWLEQFYKAKLGRNSPMEESRLRAERANTAFREEIREARPANNWFEQFYRAKYGRGPK